ncbi:conserved hypothetical protein [Phenylobacterium zucineum HLK1]|uniref:PepSY domain-containing protein n=1 Tax=Phenylobacterium zucineum (strain HLK1) TaxID=450851 RepID=B4RGF0_PHEZH|nr:hypothetical protein [Phenylobacterium zucineum]ACG78856.1 conserved hypothetical protein [Phenylobacterium zucineum HLK1]
MRWLLAAALAALSLGPAQAAEVPADVAAAVKAAMPQMKITEAELKARDGRRYYDVEGVLPDGSEIELDMLQTAAGWQVVEIQRDIAWASAPAQVHAAAQPAWKGPAPARVIESKQTDGSIVYELFAPGRPGTPALEVMLKDGKAEVLKEVWPH